MREMPCPWRKSDFSLVSGRAGGELSEDTREGGRLLIKIIDSKILGGREEDE